MEKYKDSSLPVEERLEDLMGRMTFEEKIDQITCLVTITDEIPSFKEYAPNGIGNVGAFAVADRVEKIVEYADELQRYLVNETRLGIPALIHCEACAGAQYTEADVFPSAIAQASTFNPDIVEQMAKVIRQQMLYVGFRQALSPVMDVDRDPRWGRMTETYGEDATLISSMSSAFVRGIQSEDLKSGILATAKHFVGHGAVEGGINMGRSLLSKRELLEIHCKPFQCAITEAGLKSVMNSYGSIDGEPVVGSKKILTEILRNDLGFQGVVVSDYLSIDRLVDPFSVASTFEEAGIQAIEAGLDVEYPRAKGFHYNMKKMVEQGRLSMSVIDRAVERVLRLKFELGIFENPYPDLEKLKGILHSEKTERLNEKIAEESFILLKNENNVLPLSKQIKKIAVVGPHGDNIRSLFGTFSYPAVIDMTMSREEDGQEFLEPGVIIYDIEQEYVGQVRDTSPRVNKRIQKEFPKAKTLYQALREYLPNTEVVYAKGINCTGTEIGGMEAAVRAAADADVVLLTLGGKNGWGSTSTVGEGVDATDIDLPGRQEEFARKIYQLHKKTIVLHYDGRPLSNEYIASHFEAIVEVWQPGAKGSDALCRMLFGEVNPSGRLPITAARNVGQIPIYYGLPRGSGYVGAGHTGMIRNKNGYINDTAEPLYCFGHGLSYTSFEYSDMKIEKKIVDAFSIIEVEVFIKNVGGFDGTEVVQMYFSDIVSQMIRPTMELAGFIRVALKKGERKKVQFQMKVSQFAFLNRDMQWFVEKGDYILSVGSSSRDIRLKEQVHVTNSAVIDGKTRGFYANAAVV